MSPDREKRRQQQADWYLRNKDAVKAEKARSYQERRALHLCWEARRRAKRKGITFTLTAEDIANLQARVNRRVCEVTGVALDLSRGRKWNAPSLDRVDSSRGYEIDNVRVVCHAINAALSDWGEEVLWDLFQAWAMTRSSRKSPRRS